MALTTCSKSSSLWKVKTLSCRPTLSTQYRRQLTSKTWKRLIVWLQSQLDSSSSTEGCSVARLKYTISIMTAKTSWWQLFRSSVERITKTCLQQMLPLQHYTKSMKNLRNMVFKEQKLRSLANSKVQFQRITAISDQMTQLLKMMRSLKMKAALLWTSSSRRTWM